MPDLTRTFIAIELNKDIQDELSKLQSELKKSGADVKWVKKENIHLTLKFLGEIAEEKIKKVKIALDEIFKQQCVFEIKLQGVGAFPKLSYPRVIWAGITTGKETMVEIANIIESRLEKDNFKKEARAFSPHITIGRSRSNLNRTNLVEQIDKFQNWEASEMPVNKITLFKSTLTPGGPIYEPLYIKNLKTI